MIYFQTDRGVLHQGHVMDILKGMEAKSVHCVTTSPPYWGLRDYGIEPQVWDTDPDCEHVWGNKSLVSTGRNDSGEKRPNFHGQANGYGGERNASQGQFCQNCGAWRGSLGLEPTPELFIDHIVQIFREVKRVLHKSGTVWLNLGDSYAGGQGRWGGYDNIYGKQATNKGSHTQGKQSGNIPPGLKPKDLCEIPSDVVRALRADGWWLRSRLPWLKRNSMPGSEKDRPSGSGSTVEYVFLLTKSAKYFYDNEAVKVPNSPGGKAKIESSPGTGSGMSFGTDGKRYARLNSVGTEANGRERRPSDWFFESWQGLYEENGEPLGFVVNPQSFKGAHFATFPEKLVEPCIKAGTSEKGCCPECGEPWVRVVERGELVPDEPQYKPRGANKPEKGVKTAMTPAGDKQGHPNFHYESKTINWKPGCKCHISESFSVCGDSSASVSGIPQPIPCTVLDPFAGSCTVAVVAERLRRNWIACELSTDYCQLSKNRVKESIKQRRLF